MITRRKPLSARLPVLKKFVLVSLASYAACLILIGPYLALLGTGRFDFLPRTVRDIPMYPAVLIYKVPILRLFYDDYLTWWYTDPNAADPPTGWH